MRGDCAGGCRPCPLVSCKHHLLLDIGSDGRLLKTRKFDESNEKEISKALKDMPYTCSLDVADKGPNSIGHVANIMNQDRQQISSLLSNTMAKIKAAITPQEED